MRRGAGPLELGERDPAIAVAAERSPLVHGPPFSAYADAAEHVFREQHEPYTPLEVADVFLRRKRVTDYFAYALRRTRLQPHGVVVELGAGSCWASALLARFDAVERVVAVEFSERRLTAFAPVLIAMLRAPAEKVERRVADFYAHGLPPESADLVVLDAAFHHAADPARLADVVFELVRPGGAVVLLREPTLPLLARSRDHGIEARFGDFEHEYRRGEYVRFLADAGFDARSVRVRWFHTSRVKRLLFRPPLTSLSGVLRGHYVYVGEKPAGGSPASPRASSASARSKSSG